MCMYALVYSTVVECHACNSSCHWHSDVSYDVYISALPAILDKCIKNNCHQVRNFVPLYFPKTSKKIPCCNYVYNHECVGQ